MRGKELNLLTSELSSGLSATEAENKKAVFASELSNGEQKNQDIKDELDIKLQYNNEDNDNFIDFEITITNLYSKELNLRDLNLKYYMTHKSEKNDVVECYYAGTCNGEYRILTGHVKGIVEKIGCERCADITFDEGRLKIGQSISLQFNIHDKDWESRYDQIDKSLCRIECYINVHPDGNKGKDSKLLEHEIGYVSAVYNEQDIIIKLNGNKLTDIVEKKYDDSESEEEIYRLQDGCDYILRYNETEDECIVMLKGSYLKRNSFGLERTYRNIQFNFSGGKSQNLGIDTIHVGPSNRFLMQLATVEGRYDTVLSIPVLVDALNYYKGIDSCTSEIYYDPSEVEVVSVIPGDLVNESDKFEYKDDIEDGRIKIEYKADNCRDVSYLKKGRLLNVQFRGKNGRSGSKSHIYLFGEGCSRENPDKPLRICNTINSSIIFNPDESSEVIFN